MHSIAPIYLRGNCPAEGFSAHARLVQSGSIIPFPRTVIRNLKRSSQLTTTLWLDSFPKTQFVLVIQKTPNICVILILA